MIDTKAKFFIPVLSTDKKRKEVYFILSEKNYSLRTKNGITQEDLAGKLDVTRQSV